jgi:hypothetical protein
MIWLFKRDEVVEVPNGCRVVLSGGWTSVVDAEDHVLCRYDSHDVLLYTANEEMATLLTKPEAESLAGVLRKRRQSR